MPRPAVFQGTCLQNCSVRIRATVKDSDAAGSLLYSGSIASLRYRVLNKSAGTTPVSWTAINPVTGAFATNSGDLDSAGNNFNFLIEETAFTSAGLYYAQFEITTTAGDVGMLFFNLNCIATD